MTADGHQSVVRENTIRERRGILLKGYAITLFIPMVFGGFESLGAATPLPSKTPSMKTPSLDALLGFPTKVGGGRSSLEEPSFKRSTRGTRQGVFRETVGSLHSKDPKPSEFLKRDFVLSRERGVLSSLGSDSLKESSELISKGSSQKGISFDLSTKGLSRIPLKGLRQGSSKEGVGRGEGRDSFSPYSFSLDSSLRPSLGRSSFLRSGESESLRVSHHRGESPSLKKIPSRKTNSMAGVSLRNAPRPASSMRRGSIQTTAQPTMQRFLEKGKARGQRALQGEVPKDDMVLEKRRRTHLAKSKTDYAQKIERWFSYGKGSTREEKQRWGRVGFMNHQSDGPLESMVQREKSHNKAYRDIQEASNKRMHFRDVHRERFWNTPEMKEALKDPNKILRETFTGCKEEPVYKTTFKKKRYRCHEGKPLMHHTCTGYLKYAKQVQKRLQYRHTKFKGYMEWDFNLNLSNWRDYQRVRWYFERSHKVRPKKFTRFPREGDMRLDFLPEGRYTWFCGLNHWAIDLTQHYTPQKREISINPLGEITYGPWELISREAYDDLNDERQDIWVSNCEALEEKVRAGICQKVHATCIGGEKSLKIKGEGEDIDFTRECFQKEYFYKCRGTLKNNCGSLREEGCYQVSSKCLERQGPECIGSEIIMECMKPFKEPTGEVRRICGDQPYGMEGHREEYVPNKDMMEVLSKLKVLSDSARHMTGDMDSLRIFKGSRLQCKRDMLSFRDCCNGGSGWGVGLNLAGCSGEEETLAKKRSKGHCIPVGTYCAHEEKITGICLTKKTSFCCFATKLLKVIQEQGRRQLGIGWGSAERPQCRGLSAEELSRINFEKLNMREIQGELEGSLSMDRMHKSIQERMGQMRQGLNFTPKLMKTSKGDPATDPQLEHPEVVLSRGASSKIKDPQIKRDGRSKIPFSIPASGGRVFDPTSFGTKDVGRFSTKPTSKSITSSFMNGDSVKRSFTKTSAMRTFVEDSRVHHFRVDHSRTGGREDKRDSRIKNFKKETTPLKRGGF